MTTLAWILVIALFAIGLAGAVYPVLPGVFAIYAAFFVYGWLVGFESFGFWFWSIQTTIVAVILVADYAIGAWGTKRFGGTKQGVIGSTIGVLIGPFVIPVAGLILGPFLGAVLGELLAGNDPRTAVKAGFGSVVGLFSSTVVKLILQVIMIILFLIWVL